MATKVTGLEGAAESARVIHRWLALRSKPGDEKAYEFANAVIKLHDDVRRNAVEIAAGLKDIAPLAQQIEETSGGGGLFTEARALARDIQSMRTE